MQLDLLSAFLIGLLGTGHCIGMCGGIASMLTGAVRDNNPKKQLYIICYNAGRIFSYTLLGTVVGFTSSLMVKQLGFPVIILNVIAGVFLILLGLYIGQWAFLLVHVEKVGKSLWQKLQPLSKHLIPVDSATKATFLGALWGWLPCGLIYSTLTWSLASGSALQGGLIMLSFGLGTLPALLLVSFGVSKVNALLTKIWVRRAIALMLIFYGIITLKFAYMKVF